MNKRTMRASLLAMLTLPVSGSISAAAIAAASAAPAPPVAPVVAAASALPSGLDLAGFDRSVRPQDDLYRFAGGAWLARTEIPPDRSNYGAFSVLDDAARESVHQLLDAAATAARAGAPHGSDDQKLGDFHASFMDTDRLAQLGTGPLQAELARILGIRSAADLYAWLGRAQRIGVSMPANVYVGQDARNSNSYIVTFYQGGLTMPDRDYYLATDARSVALRAAYKTYVARLLALAGHRKAEAEALRIASIEDRLANHQWTRVQNRDAVRTYNRMTLAEAERLAPGFNFRGYLAGAGAGAGAAVGAGEGGAAGAGAAAPASAIEAIDITQPSYVTELAKVVRDTPLADWRLYLEFRLYDAYAPYLNADFDAAHFGFHSHELQGVQEQQPRWRRSALLLDGEIGELVGKRYIERSFAPESRAKIQALVQNLLRAFDAGIDELAWMGPATRAEARRKLAHIGVKVGYPDRWRDYSKLEILRGDLVGNVRRAEEFEFDRRLAQLGGPVDRAEWLITPQTVNAYYNPKMNEILFPAAILHPPFFDPAVDDATNYGAIGGVIGHEISHGFDDQGRQYDGDGNLRDWWTPEDAKRFGERAAKLVAQYSSYTVIEDRKLNGQLTLGENIGDLSGLAVALRAWRLSLGGSEPPLIDGFSGTQRFFLGWAQVWRRKHRDDDVRMRLVMDPHSPEEFRCNGVVTNLDAFQEAFALGAGDRLYRSPGERVKIW
jgi:predicted metalloendopeptidase